MLLSYENSYILTNKQIQKTIILYTFGLNCQKIINFIS